MSAKWIAALAEHQREEAAYAAAAAEYEADCAAYHDERPDRDDEFTAYGLKSPNLTHRDVMSDVTAAIMTREFGKVGYPLYPPKAVEEYNAKYPAIIAEAGSITADYLDWRRGGSEAYDRIVGPAEKKHDAACDKRCEARNRLLNTSAPNAAAMLLKLELLSTILTEDDSQDAPAVVALRDDARRLLGEEA